MREAKRREKNTSSGFLLGLLNLIGSVTAACTMGCAVESEPPSVVALPPVMIAEAEVRDLIHEVKATGQLTPKFEATIASQVSGEVTSVAVEEGDAVSEGQILLEIDPELRILELANAEASTNEAGAQVSEALRDLGRVQNLRKRDATSQALLDDAQTTLELARSRKQAADARLGLARRALADATVRAPFAGLVSRRHVSSGEYLAVGVPVFELVALDPIEAEFALAEVDSSRVQLGQKVTLQLAPFPAESFEAEVTMISPIIDPLTRTLRVKALLPNPDGRLRPGLFVRVDVAVSPRPNALVVPEESLMQRVDGTVLYRLVANDRVERLVVKPGTLLDGWVEITEGLSPGDFIVVRGQEILVDGGLVSLRSADGKPLDSPNVASPGPTFSAGAGQ